MTAESFVELKHKFTSFLFDFESMWDVQRAQVDVAKNRIEISTADAQTIY